MFPVPANLTPVVLRAPPAHNGKPLRVRPDRVAKLYRNAQARVMPMETKCGPMTGKTFQQPAQPVVWQQAHAAPCRVKPAPICRIVVWEIMGPFSATCTEPPLAQAPRPLPCGPAPGASATARAHAPHAPPQRKIKKHKTSPPRPHALRVKPEAIHGPPCKCAPAPAVTIVHPIEPLTCPPPPLARGVGGAKWRGRVKQIHVLHRPTVAMS